MVDSINPSGSSANVLSVGKAQKFEDKTKAAAPASNNNPVDELRISNEAINLSEVSRTTGDVSVALRDNPDLTLSNNTERLSALI